jgi:hypothetical protein
LTREDQLSRTTFAVQGPTRRHPHPNRGSLRRSPGPTTVGPAHPLDTRAILGLQRSAGNRSVTSMLGHRPVPVQRGLFDMLGGLLGGGGGGLRQQAAGLAGQGVQAGIGALAGKLGGPFGQILQGAGSGLAGAASSLVGGDTGGALATLRETGMAAAMPAAQAGMGMLGGAIGGQAGQVVGGLGESVGQGLSSVIGGGSPAAAGMGVVQAAQPGVMGLLSRFLGGF